MSLASSPPVPSWWHRTWPLVALGVLSVAMWTGRIRNILGDDSLGGPGRAFRLGLAVSFVTAGALVLVASWVGWRRPNWREVARHGADGWTVGPGVPHWGITATVLLCGWTAVVWIVQGVGILLDPNHDAEFKLIHTVLMVGSLVVAGTAAWGLRRRWSVSSPSKVG